MVRSFVPDSLWCAGINLHWNLSYKRPFLPLLTEPAMVCMVCGLFRAPPQLASSKQMLIGNSSINHHLNPTLLQPDWTKSSEPSPSSLIPVAIVQVLPEQCVGLHGPIGVHLGHVQVIDKVHQPLCAWGAVVPASLFLQRLLQHTCRGRSYWE